MFIPNLLENKNVRELKVDWKSLKFLRLLEVNKLEDNYRI